MREFSTPGTYVVPPHGNLTDDVLRHLERPDEVVLFRRQPRAEPHAEPHAGPDSGPTVPTGSWLDVTARQFRDDVVAVAKGLVAADVQPGDRVGLLARTRYEWPLVDYAIWWVGAVSVPVYETSSADQVRWVLADSGAVACVVERADHAARVESVRGRLAGLRHVWTLDDGPRAGAVPALARLGLDVADDELEKRRAAVSPDDLATLIYTSGTTGRPRGCRLTHANIMVAVSSLTEALDEVFGAPGASTVLFLPLAHVFARTVQVGCVRSGVSLGHTRETADTAELVSLLGGFRPTFLVAVPRLLERVYTSASQQSSTAVRTRVFSSAASSAVAWSRARATGTGGPGRVLRARRAVYERLVYRGLRGVLGGRVRYALCNGGPLDDRLGHFFRGVGVTVLEGYGLTETTSAVTANRPGEHEVGTVGRPLPGVTVRVGDDGELLFRGGQVFDGYWGDDDQSRTHTAEVLAGGWLHTGDLGEVDGEGFVRVTGRRTEILVTAGGKNVAPSMLEDRIRAHPLISHCLVVGDGRPYVAALVTLDADAATVWAQANDRGHDIAELADDPDLRDEIQSAVDAANAGVSPAEAVRRFRVLSADWTEEAGHLTPSLRLKRALVVRDHRAEIESLYEPAGG